MPRAVGWLGLVSGWLCCLLLDRFGAISFAPPAPGAGIPSWCTLHGYAKAADWFWIAAWPLAGIGGAWGASRLHAAVKRSGSFRRLPNLPVWPAAVSVAGATILLFARDRRFFPLALLLAVAGVGWPWLSRRWYARPADDGREPTTSARIPRPVSPIAWAGMAVALALCWIVDPCLRSRDLDLLHEGVHLLLVQSWLAGDLGSGLVHTMYGPLYTRSMAWWMSAFDMTALSLRWYFLAAQAAGMATALLCLRAVCSTRTALAAGTWLLLTAACTGPYGWANILRVTLPLASVVLISTAGRSGAGRTDGRIPPATRVRARAGVAGVLAALGLLYSPEFGLAGIAASVVAILGRGRDRSAVAAAWGPAGGAVLLGFWSAMYGAGSWRAATDLLGNDYPAARLGGDVSYPLHTFRWPADAAGLEPLWRSLSVWGPVLLVGSAVATRVVGSIAVYAALAMIPAIARPLGHQAMAAPAWILLAAIWLDALLRGRRRIAATAVVVGLAAWGLLAPDAGARALLARWTCAPSAGLVSAPADWRLGGIMLPPDQARLLGKAVPLIRRLCPPDGRIVLAAPSYLGLAFLAGRAGAPPFPLTLRAVPAADRRLLVSELDRLRPPLAVVTFAQLDVPLPVANPELWAYLRSTYRPLRVLDPLIFYIRE